MGNNVGNVIPDNAPMYSGDMEEEEGGGGVQTSHPLTK
jgi:hypothetical protein